MSKRITLISPSDGTMVAQRELASDSEVQAVLARAHQAQADWQHTALVQRQDYCAKAVDWLVAHKQEISREISAQMGRPIRYASSEINGLQARAQYMIDIAETALADLTIESSPDFTRFIRPTPLGTVLVIAPWNYPYLTAVNTIIPALLAGNTVILKHSSKTLLCAERFTQAFAAAGLPAGVFQHLHLDHRQCEALIGQPAINFVCFTGSVAGGKAIEQAAAGHFKTLALELGGKDAAFVRADAPLDMTIKNLVEGAFFNSGQSCCGIERIYVHRACYDDFVSGYVSQTRALRLGHALESETDLGPMADLSTVETARAQISQAQAQGAQLHIDERAYPLSQAGSHYLAPQVLTGVTQEMAIMRQESFAPVVGIMPVDSDQQALQLINDSQYGLTASIWSQDAAVVEALGERIHTGTVFMNRCDYLDPALAWVGVKDSGRGCSLSQLAYQQLTRPKSFHLKHRHLKQQKAP